MLTLSILRHAHAERGDDDLPDFERALDKRGRREARRVAQYLAAQDALPDHLLTSPAVRTVQTTKAVAQAVGFALERIRHDDRLYLADAQPMLDILKSAPGTVRHVLLVGHNPGLSVLASRLDDTHELGELPTAGLVRLEFPVRHWRELDWRTGRRHLLVTPDELGEEP